MNPFGVFALVMAGLSACGRYATARAAMRGQRRVATRLYPRIRRAFDRHDGIPAGHRHYAPYGHNESHPLIPNCSIPIPNCSLSIAVIRVTIVIVGAEPRMHTH